MDATGYADLIAALGRITTADILRRISGKNYMRVLNLVSSTEDRSLDAEAA